MKVSIFFILLLVVTNLTQAWGQGPDMAKILEEKEETLISMQTKAFIGQVSFFKGLGECAKAYYSDLIRRAAEESGFPEDKLLEVILLESGCDPKAKNPSGAAGIGQIMPLTGKDLGLVEYRTIKKKVAVRQKKKIKKISVHKKVIVRDDRLNPVLAVLAAAKHLAGIAERLGIENAVWAYHAGEGLVKRFFSVARKTPGWENEDFTPAKMFFLAHSGKNPELASMLERFNTKKHDWTSTYLFRVICAGRLFKSYVAGAFDQENFSCASPRHEEKEKEQEEKEGQGGEGGLVVIGKAESELAE
uniref:Transglycosylase, Slt family n=2 Tax=Candidatus Giovannoniibacteriota TaxID=1752738 RepID=A0A0G0ZCC5_9BACT|nr:MAG: Transglycosylase, Slt family [Candidatus Giovannonibacteria bacterium GW2011_GWF2_42_19]